MNVRNSTLVNNLKFWRRQNLAQAPITDETMVIDYLLSNPDFFVEHADILTRLKIPHDAGGAVSLVERQIEIYREKSLRLEKQLKDLLEVARENERIGQLLHQFAGVLMRTQSTAAVVKATRQSILRDFHTDQVKPQTWHMQPCLGITLVQCPDHDIQTFVDNLPLQFQAGHGGRWRRRKKRVWFITQYHFAQFYPCS